jgi:DNA modification methylase
MPNVIDQIIKDNYSLYNGDSCEIIKGIPDNSIHYTIFSPPFASLYTYSNSERDMGNCKTDEQFYEHFKYLAKELYRVTMPGRLLSFHCMDLPMMKERDGAIGLKDFPAIIRQVFEDVGFIYHSRVTIWKNPVTEMQRTKALGLLHKQVKKDSSMVRMGIPDYIITMRKDGDNPEKITHTDEEFPVDVWQRYASPVWMDINQSDTLQRESAREQADERHICPLQLPVIQRCIELWTNANDIVLDPFGGIGSTAYVERTLGRRAISCELKSSYYRQMVANVASAEELRNSNAVGGQISFDDLM